MKDGIGRLNMYSDMREGKVGHSYEDSALDLMKSCAVRREPGASDGGKEKGYKRQASSGRSCDCNS